MLHMWECNPALPVCSAVFTISYIMYALNGLTINRNSKLCPTISMKSFARDMSCVRVHCGNTPFRHVQVR